MSVAVSAGLDKHVRTRQPTRCCVPTVSGQLQSDSAVLERSGLHTRPSAAALTGTGERQVHRQVQPTAGRAFRSCRTRHIRTWFFVTEGSSKSTQSLPR